MRFRLPIIVVAAVGVMAAVPILTWSAGRQEKTSGADFSPGPSSGTQPANPQALAEATKNLATIQYSFREVAKKVPFGWKTKRKSVSFPVLSPPSVKACRVKP